MKYNVNDYFRNYLMFLSKKNGMNLQEKDISSYLRALSNYMLREGSINLSQHNIYFDILDDDNIKILYIDSTDNSLNCRIELQDAVYRIKLVNDKLYYSIYFNNNDYKEDLNGIYFYESDEVGNTVYKFYDTNTKERVSNSCMYRNCNLVDADDFMLRTYGFSPDYEEKHEYKGMLEYDAARAFNDLLLTIDYNKTIDFISSINKKTENKLNYRLNKKM